MPEVGIAIAVLLALGLGCSRKLGLAVPRPKTCDSVAWHLGFRGDKPSAVELSLLHSRLLQRRNRRIWNSLHYYSNGRVVFPRFNCYDDERGIGRG